MTKKAINEQGQLVDVPDNTPVKTIDGVHHLLTQVDLDEIAARKLKGQNALAVEIEKHKKIYREKRVAEGITINTIPVATDDISQQRFIAARMLAKEDSNYTVKWKAQNGFVELSASEIITIADSVREHVQKCFDAHAEILDTTYTSKQEVETAFDSAYDSL